MIDELERIWKESTVAKSRDYPYIHVAGIKKHLRIIGVPAEIRTGRLPNKSQSRYQSIS
jgi:hypothetical protein